MPELPEVRTVCKMLKQKIINNQIIKVDIFTEKLIKEISVKEFINYIKNKTIINIFNIGKNIIFDLGYYKIISHLRMEGKYRIEKEGFQRRNSDHIFFHLNNKILVYNDSRLFGTFHLRNENNILKTNPIMKLAKEPQNTNIDELRSKLKRKKIAIKSALLDQTLLVGLGNIYVNEVLWDVKINPKCQANNISYEKLKLILKSSENIMNKSTELGGTTIKSYTSLNNTEGNFQKFLKVHSKVNTPCPRCDAIIKKIKVNGRGTYYCPTCQK